MGDFKNLLIYGGLSLAVILGLVFMSATDSISPGMVGGLAILFVVILPVVVAVRISKQEKLRKQQQQQNEES